MQSAGMLTHIFASAGPVTGAFQELAASIGSGLVVGSFAVGAGSFVSSRSREQSERSAVTGGYSGGGVALVLLGFDIVRKYFV
jgi:hypothetical protein